MKRASHPQPQERRQTAPGSDVTLSVSPERVTRILGIAVTALAIAHLLGVVSRHALDRDHVFGLVRLFDLDREHNIPTLFASWLLLLNGCMLATTAWVQRQRERRDWPFWACLGVTFLFLSVDELWSIHERLIEPVRTALGTSGAFHFAWVIPYGIVVVLLGLASLRFLAGLERDVRRSLFVAGALYVGGAIGVEMLGGYHAERFGENNASYGLITMVEETLELTGLVVLVRSILLFARSEMIALNLRFAPRESARTASTCNAESPQQSSSKHAA